MEAGPLGPKRGRLCPQYPRTRGVGVIEQDRKVRRGVLRLAAMHRDVTLRIVVESPPKGVDFSLQKGRGSAYNTVQNQRSQCNDLTF